MKKLLVFSLLLTGLATGCASQPIPDRSGSLAAGCQHGLNKADQELGWLESSASHSSWDFTKASGLVTAAKIQFEFGEYPDCIDKVKRARRFIQKTLAAN